jgi:hypothetical protein
MASDRQTLKIAPADEQIALRLLSAVILGWDRIPLAMQGWIMRDAFMMKNGKSIVAPETLMAFIDTYKDSVMGSEEAKPTGVLM